MVTYHIHVVTNPQLNENYNTITYVSQIVFETISSSGSIQMNYTRMGTCKYMMHNACLGDPCELVLTAPSVSLEVFH